MSALILDNFLPYPTVVREWAINQKYYTAKEFSEKYNQHTDWPGRRTEHVVDLDKDYANVVLSQISNIAQKSFGLTNNMSIRSYFQLTLESDGDSWVHQDNDIDLAGILYLNPNPPVNSGTTIYHCKNEAYWQSFMSTTEGYETLKSINRIDNSELYNHLFNPIDDIGNVFNRLILYPGITYHKSNDYFGDSIKNGRLTQVFFMKQEK
jgi:hypothetical protein